MTGKGRVYYEALEKGVKLAQQDQRIQPAASPIADDPNLRQDGEHLCICDCLAPFFPLQLLAYLSSVSVARPCSVGEERSHA